MMDDVCLVVKREKRAITRKGYIRFGWGKGNVE